MIAIVDYGAGNLRSVAKAIEKLGYSYLVTAEPERVLEAEAVILPGVGAAGEAMRSLERLGLVAPLRQVIAEDRPFFGVCLGLQLLFAATEEGGGERCLGIVSGRVRRLPPGLKVPHMGWNQVGHKIRHPIFQGISDEANFYFVHSYYGEPEDSSLVAGETEYGIPFCSMLVRGNLVATQFHPEKSGELGLQLYHNFLLFGGVRRG
ncbi:MAG: imidazole glycerol phosphate synthase subunit HisH [Chloroflexi bacterium]|nr:imidazole glycerol phosphate synthase subunit HisH [Chloroflexota bacterium]